MDKYEVSVARWRNAVKAGLVTGSTPLQNDGSIPLATNCDAQDGEAFCTYSLSPMGREDFPVSCVNWVDARAFCLMEGGDLPSSVQWEWVAAAAGRPAKTAFPWGGADLCDFPCSRGDFGRGYVNECCAPGQCLSAGLGPASVIDADHENGDRSAGFGVVDLAFNLAEWVKDSSDDLDTRCWLEQPIHATACNDPANPERLTRGGSWQSPAFDGSYASPSGVPEYASTPEVGLRCVRQASP
jgi:formylglycine-generating enzyme required for sulfatase activity